MMLSVALGGRKCSNQLQEEASTLLGKNEQNLDKGYEVGKRSSVRYQGLVGVQGPDTRLRNQVCNKIFVILSSKYLHISHHLLHLAIHTYPGSQCIAAEDSFPCSSIGINDGKMAKLSANSMQPNSLSLPSQSALRSSHPHRW